jgi:hypothetical protein
MICKDIQAWEAVWLPGCVHSPDKLWLRKADFYPVLMPEERLK